MSCQTNEQFHCVAEYWDPKFLLRNRKFQSLNVRWEIVSLVTLVFLAHSLQMLGWRTYPILGLNRFLRRSQWPRGLRRGSAAARLLGLWVWFPPEAWMFVSCECRVLLGRGLCVVLITRPEASYQLWNVWVWSLNLDNEAPLGAVAPWQKTFSSMSFPFHYLLFILPLDVRYSEWLTTFYKPGVHIFCQNLGATLNF